MTSPKVSVLMPVYNGLPFLKESIESILSQSFSDFEFIIIDDGSGDDASRLINIYSAEDSRIKVFRNEVNMGIVFSLNRGLKECSGDYIVRMDADDIAMPDRLRKQVNWMESNPDICVSGGALSYINAIGNDLNLVRYCDLGRKLSKCPLLHPTVIIRRGVLTRHGLCYLEKYRFAEDYFLWLQLSQFGKISAIKDVVVKYRLNNQATKVKRLKSSLLATLKVKKDAVFILNIKPSLRDAGMVLVELILLILPARLVWQLYLMTTFKKGTKVIL